MPNRLASEPSPYLKQHKDNPVDWYPWGPEALERAKRENRPILLSVGYSACHWCHVMAHESFENPQIAALMNQHFVNIKIDREERPDVDHLYQGVVQLMGKGGGWPLTVFLTPELKPFYGGTYFPSHDKYGMPGFPKLLSALADAWATERNEVQTQAARFEEGLKHYASVGLDAPPGALTGADVAGAAALLESKVDRKHGGFGRGGPKFPNPMNVQLLLRGWRRSGSDALKSAALLTLEKMATGGVYDQLGGGFHRYSVDERWLVPHFEKMLYDNAQLLHLYSEAQQVEPRALWQKTVEETVAYLQREMTHPRGAFFAAQDADSDGEEGKFFVWSAKELAALLPKDHAALVREHFGVSDVGNFEGGANVLEVVKPMQDPKLALAKATMLAERGKRVRPGLDDKILAGWNGLAIRGLSFASRVFGREDWAQAARRAADFVLSQLRGPDGSLYRSWQEGPRLTGMLEDYGDLCAGLTALFQATFDKSYLDAAEQLADLAYGRFWDEKERAYLAAPKGTADLLMPTWALHDNAFPSGASSLTEAQVSLAALTGHERHLERASKYLERVAVEMKDNPFGFGHLWLAADAFVDGAPGLTLPHARAGELRAMYLPTVAMGALKDDAKPDAFYLCRSFTCLAPVTELGALKSQLAGLTR